MARKKAKQDEEKSSNESSVSTDDSPNVENSSIENISSDTDSDQVSDKTPGDYAMSGALQSSPLLSLLPELGLDPALFIPEISEDNEFQPQGLPRSNIYLSSSKPDAGLDERAKKQQNKQKISGQRNPSKKPKRKRRERLPNNFNTGFLDVQKSLIRFLDRGSQDSSASIIHKITEKLDDIETRYEEQKSALETLVNIVSKRFERGSEEVEELFRRNFGTIVKNQIELQKHQDRIEQKQTLQQTALGEDLFHIRKGLFYISKHLDIPSDIADLDIYPFEIVTGYSQKETVSFGDLMQASQIPKVWKKL